MKKIFLVGIIIGISLVNVGCGGSNKIQEEQSNQQQEQVEKEEKQVELSNNIQWKNAEEQLIAEVTVGEIRKFDKKDELYDNIKEKYPKNDLYLINYEYKNGEVNDKLEITLNDFKVYMSDGTLLEGISNGMDSFTGEISKNKKATTDFLVVAPEGAIIEDVTFEVEKEYMGLNRKEGKQKINK